MKKIYNRLLAILIITGCFFSDGLAQTSSTYIYFKPIYCFPGSSQTLETSTQSVANTTYTQGVYGSFATGLSLEIGVGKMINKNFGFELAAEWMKGNEVHANLSIDSSVTSISGEGFQMVKSFMLKPMLILRNSGDLLTFYSKLGLVISAYSQGNDQATAVISDSGQSMIYNVSEINKIKPKVGFAAAFGICARVSQSVALTAEISGQMLSLPEKNGYYTQFVENGINKLPDLKKHASLWTWNYEKSISSAAGNIDQPDTRIYTPLNFSYIGISVGLRYYF